MNSFQVECKNTHWDVYDEGELIQKMVRTLHLFERAALTRHGFTYSQSYVMVNVYRSKNMTMNQLSEKMNLDTSTITRIVATLQRDQYLYRERNPEDRRVIFIRLTEKGEQAAKELLFELREFYQKLLSNLPSGEEKNVQLSAMHLLRAFEKLKRNCS